MIPEQANFFPWCSDKFAKHLHEYVGKPNLKFLEIGSYAGSSAVGMLETILTDKSSTLTCVDICFNPFAEKIFDRETARFGNQVIKQVAWSKEWLENNQDKEFDFIYIDGDHSAEAVKNDVKLSWNILKQGGILALDDYLYEHTRGKEFNPKQVIDEFVKSVKDTSEILEISGQVWIRK